VRLGYAVGIEAGVDRRRDPDKRENRSLSVLVHEQKFLYAVVNH
jgi:hypothetical protein